MLSQLPKQRELFDEIFQEEKGRLGSHKDCRSGEACLDQNEINNRSNINTGEKGPEKIG